MLELPGADAGMSRRAVPEVNPVVRRTQGTPVSRRAVPEMNPVVRRTQERPVCSTHAAAQISVPRKHSAERVGNAVTRPVTQQSRGFGMADQ